MGDVNRHRQHRARGDTGRVARAAHESEREHAEHEGFDAGAARVGGDRPLPPARGRPLARVSRQEEHEERPREEDGGGEVYPRRSEKEEPHSTLNAKPPSVTSASIDSTRHLTRYVPGGSAGSVTRSSTGFERSTRLSPRSTCPPRSFTTRTEL